MFLGAAGVQERRDALTELSRPGGVLDANDPLEVGPTRLITEPELSPDNLDNPTLSAGNAFVGQFLDHDITRDAGSRLGRPVSLQRSTNLRTATFDLDSVYGGGPGESPDLYDDDLRFIVESGGLFEDVPRHGDGQPIIADPRNDENLIISGMQAGFLLFHNAVMARVEASGLRDDAAFDEAQQIVRWHYQWMILNDYLPGIVCHALVDDIRANGRRFYNPTRAIIPVEFQTSAYRFGHSQVRPSYRANLAADEGEPFFALVFDPATFGQDDPDDLTGGHRAQRRFIGWQTFFDFGDGEVKNNKSINPRISSPLFRLPMSTLPVDRGGNIGPTSLATRNLLRHLTWEIATGQQIADQMGADRLTAADISIYGDFGANLDTATPLWLYLLREAELIAGGETLGPIGGRIVAEVFIGLLEMDPSSYVSAQPGWTPTLPNRNGAENFGMADILTIARVDPASRGQ
ncbi:MAG: hypothetical protein ACI81L_002062 [Verrucomicrobiales bacterium]|jgi:hypothetical protein